MKRRAPQYYCTTLYYFALHSITLFYTVLLRTILYYLGEARRFFSKNDGLGPTQWFWLQILSFWAWNQSPVHYPPPGPLTHINNNRKPPQNNHNFCRAWTALLLRYTVLLCTTQCYFVLHNTTLYYTVLLCTTQYSDPWKGLFCNSFYTQKCRAGSLARVPPLRP